MVGRDPFLIRLYTAVWPFGQTGHDRHETEFDLEEFENLLFYDSLPFTDYILPNEHSIQWLNLKKYLLIPHLFPRRKIFPHLGAHVEHWVMIDANQKF